MWWEMLRDAFAARRLGNRGQMRSVRRSRIDHRDVAGADDIGVGAEEGIGARIVGHDAPDVRRDLLGHAVIDIGATIESKLR